MRAQAEREEFQVQMKVLSSLSCIAGRHNPRSSSKQQHHLSQRCEAPLALLLLSRFRFPGPSGVHSQAQLVLLPQAAVLAAEGRTVVVPWLTDQFSVLHFSAALLAPPPAQPTAACPRLLPACACPFRLAKGMKRWR